MYSPKEKFSIDDQKKISCSDVDPSIRSYALIETDSNELDHIIDLLRNFFPKTKIIEYNNYDHNSSNVTPSQKSSFEIDDQMSSNANSPTFKGKVKDYLQRRYLGQMSEHPIRKETITKSRSLDTSKKSSIIHSSSKRGLLQRYTTIDIDDSLNDTEKLSLNIDQINDDDEVKSPSIQYSYSEQSNKNKTNLCLLPYQEQEKKTSVFPSPMSIPLPLTPYSASSDPGPFHSPWFNTPTSNFKFRFPQGQEQAVVNAQGSIAQLSTLTKMLCDEPSVFTPISPRFKLEKHDWNTSTDSSSVPCCQICREEFDSHKMYLSHYRQHLENSGEHNKSNLLDFDINSDRSDESRNYSCNICLKRFSRDMLNRHLRLHSGVRPYRCRMCNTNFSRSDHLSTHLRTHTGEKPYTCPHCSYTACRRDMITRHLKIHGKQRTARKNATSTFASSNDA